MWLQRYADYPFYFDGKNVKIALQPLKTQPSAMGGGAGFRA